ncbi:MAG: hypothetical protein AMS15_09530 [Planctomycetes bacterium DG_23]|nr:MAG: hypothetical protein AMS15_09530 [Planctomycetes bacterium DG_23]
MQLRIDYGRSGLEVEIPDENLAEVITLRPMPSLAEPEDVVRSSLAEPIGAPPLTEIARGKKTACVVVSDFTRPVPNKIILPPLLEVLLEAGIAKENIALLVGTGMHRPNTSEELKEMLGEDVLKQYPIIQHNARDKSQAQFLGTAPAGTPVYINRHYLEAELKIATGLIEPHLMAGYSGGRKAICPGISSLETTKFWHSPRFLESERATSGILQDNPVHQEAQAIAGMAGCDFILNVVIDAERKISGLFAGDLKEAFAAGVRFMENFSRVPINAPCDVVITTCAGYPLDTTFYQAIKGLVGALPAVKAGGTIIMAASLSEGLGGEEFSRALLETDNLDDFVEDIIQGERFVIDQWQIEELAKALRKARVMLYSEGLDENVAKNIFVEPTSSVEEGIERALAYHGKRARIAVIPKGPYSIPYLPAT